MKRTCSIPICNEPAYGRGWCKAHHQRWLTKGDPGTTPITKKRPDQGCKVEGCDRPHSNRGWCRPHYRRWWEKGDPGPVEIYERPAIPTYTAAHQRVRAARGSCRDQLCACGKPATAWAYQYDDPDVLVDESGLLYSADPTHYAPMCTVCHRALDRGHRERMARVFATAPGGLFW